jgi:hypothetical protein
MHNTATQTLVTPPPSRHDGEPGLVRAMYETPLLERIIGMTTSLLYPIQMVLNFGGSQTSSHKKRQWLLAGLAVANFILVALLNEWILKLLKAAAPNSHINPVGSTAVVGVCCAVLVNCAVLALLTLTDLSRIIAAAFGRQARAEVWDWMSRIMGHKMWAGENTHKLLQSLAEGLPDLGRSKWLLLNFMQQDVESKINSAWDFVATNATRSATGGAEERCLYEVNVRDWDIRQYSDFLAQNMVYAEKRIQWVVDPFDFFAQILPAHIMEVCISVGMEAIDKVDSLVKNADKCNPTGQTCEALLFKMRQDCPNRPRCPNGCFPDSVLKQIVLKENRTDHQRMRELDWIWLAAYCRTLSHLRHSTVLPGKDSLEVNGKTIDLGVILKGYRDRVEKGLNPRLVHVEAFGKSACEKRRHIYLGDQKNTSAEHGISKLFHEDVPASYMMTVIPELDLNEGSPVFGLMCAWSKLNRVGEALVASDVAAESPGSLMKEALSATTPAVRAQILSWALDLFALTSGGKGNVRAVFCEKAAPDMKKYENSHDIGVYDDRLEVTSEVRAANLHTVGAERAITWRLYATQSPLAREYFPADGSPDMVSFDDFVSACTRTLA